MAISFKTDIVPMPPSTSGEQPWSEDKVQLFKRWIDGGYTP
jgi:hypothetical protein